MTTKPDPEVSELGHIPAPEQLIRLDLPQTPPVAIILIGHTPEQIAAVMRECRGVGVA